MLTRATRPTMVMASTSRPITGISRVLNSISPAMKVSASPATAPSMAARGRCRCTQLPIRLMAASIRPLMKHAATATFQASSASPVRFFAGSSTPNRKTNITGVLMP